MLNLSMISNALVTFRVKGFKNGSMKLSLLSYPFALAIFSKSSMLLLINDEMSLILVKILASLFFSMNFSNSSYTISMSYMSTLLESRSLNLSEFFLSSVRYLTENSLRSSSLLSSNLLMSS
jgi:hypothetical protein